MRDLISMDTNALCDEEMFKKGGYVVVLVICSLFECKTNVYWKNEVRRKF